MAYTYDTFSDLKTELARRLSDTGYVFWTANELGLYLKEAIRVLNAFSGYYRERVTFSTSSGTAFYTLPDQVTNLAYSITTRNLIEQLQFHLLESTSSQVTWAGTSMFTMADLEDALTRRRNQLLHETACRVSRSTTLNVPPDGLVTLPDTAMDVLRVIYYDADSRYYTLYKSSEAYRGVDSGTPFAYTQHNTSPLTIQISPPPIDSGYIDIITVDAPADLTASGNELLNIPDDYAWVVKWGALADLFAKDGEARDAIRAGIALKFYNAGINLIRSQRTVISAEINGRNVEIAPIFSADSTNAGWQSRQDTPDSVLIVGPNMIALSPVPDGAHAVTLDIVRNAEIPSADDDNVQIGREAKEAVLGWAEMLATFKMGGYEMEVGRRRSKLMPDFAAIYSERLYGSNNIQDATKPMWAASRMKDNTIMMEEEA